MSIPLPFSSDEDVMRRAIALARQGLGFVEPNPAVGAVLVDARRNLLGEGWHERFGGPHAEVNALADFKNRNSDAKARSELAATATLFVTLEPCCHTGKTPPCTDAVLASGVRRVVVALGDPSLHVSGGGIAQLKRAGIDVSVGLLEAEVRQLNAPFLKLAQTGLPYVHVKWAMTLDGNIATRTGSSQWISNEKSRAVVHELRGRMDAIIVGAGTARADDPSLTARSPGPRTATRVVVDSQAALSVESQLVKTVADAPVLVATLESAPEDRIAILQTVGVDVVRLPALASGNRLPESARPDLRALLIELGRRGMTNVLVEGGSDLLGSLFDLDLKEGQQLVDEAHIFVAPKFAGGAKAVSPVGGIGLEHIPQLSQIDPLQIEVLDGDVYIHGPVVNRDPAGL
ncbi:MAG: bifunctional diaminohydroxyphosphoribosylaminopyrimidine deaminase/5-amino-6-(5-phosphoribosylamino)uracil reductase RibD [Planctomycetota bacterium]|nr:bifunctional diaminohydroxyphosphoribosylaminopyrimidine deaminase/5-amino-6-(5-phosphoribosylamino)uracil reductase RibD [Planctomycetota bacterium]MDA1250320.1 bifunctional diaminohydroxyphosphoribosylaminopyrimidine deaminase/5-amino-6-(5-phosphoribosylamino)uracil reductase RibD [Planctomycetota bacterium]